MDSESADSSSQPQTKASDVETSAAVDTDVKQPANTNEKSFNGQQCGTSCQSLSTEYNENVVVVHCKAGMGRTGLMICSLVLFLKFYPTAEEVIDYFNQKRCIDGKALVLPSQIRYVKCFEHMVTCFHRENHPGRASSFTSVLIGLCPPLPFLITVDSDNALQFQPEDFWIKAPKKGIVIFALSREPGLAEVAGDFQIISMTTKAIFTGLQHFSFRYF
ncbi:hypothetical protein V6N11_078294 [Hibiscus sabdariffa]|uniref:Tyrosine specific protein phosphatases domain-containing protein n=1 Tax=Hibiscus sabdariffa TaxID=183260 RepID=A0ABR2TFX8_9ROSI